MEGNPLLIVGTFVYEVRIELLSLVLHRFPRKRQEHRIPWLQELEIIILQKKRQIVRKAHCILKSGRINDIGPKTFHVNVKWLEVEFCGKASKQRSSTDQDWNTNKVTSGPRLHFLRVFFFLSFCLSFSNIYSNSCTFSSISGKSQLSLAENNI